MAKIDGKIKWENNLKFWIRIKMTDIHVFDKELIIKLEMLNLFLFSVSYNYKIESLDSFGKILWK